MQLELSYLRMYVRYQFLFKYNEIYTLSLGLYIIQRDTNTNQNYKDHLTTKWNNMEENFIIMKVDVFSIVTNNKHI